MKKRILIVVMGLLLTGATAFAQGDLVVNGKLGVGTSTPTGKLEVTSTNTTAIQANPTKADTNFLTGVNLNAIDSYSGSSASGTARALTVVVDHTGTPTNTYAGAEGANYQIRLLGSGTITQTFAQTNQMVFRTNSNYNISNMYGNIAFLGALGSYSGIHSLTNYYGYYSYGFSTSQTINGTNWRHAYFADFPSYSGTVANIAGLWIDKQTRGTKNYGIVLNGDGAGADLVFGDAGGSCRPRIYSVGGYVKASNKDCVESPLSPHDPETGEWVFYSKNLKTGKTVSVNMEKLVKAVEKLTGETFMIESIIED